MEFILPMIISFMLFIGFNVIIFLKCFKKVTPGTAVIRTGAGPTKVSMTSILVFPLIHKMSLVDISVKNIHLEFKDLITKDDKRVALKTQFQVRINPIYRDIQMVADYISPDKTFDKEYIKEVFEPKFIEAVKTVSPHFTFDEIVEDLCKFKMHILDVIGTDLNGYVLDDCSVFEVEIQDS